MKKKKLKKKIKKLERTIKWNTDSQKLLALKCSRLDNDIKNSKETIKKLENDNKYYKEWMDRSGVDYKSWFNFEEE